MSTAVASSSSSSATQPHQAALISPQQQVQQIIQTYKAMRANITELASKLTELDSDKTEHQLVLRAIKDLPRTRRCYRSIGGVLVERTVGDVQPAVERNVRGIEELIGRLSGELREKEREADEFRAKYNISMGDTQNDAADEEDEDDEEKSGGGGGGSRGRGGSSSNGVQQQQRRPGGGGVLA